MKTTLKMFVSCMVYGGIDWKDSTSTSEFLKEDGLYEIKSPNEVIARHIKDKLDLAEWGNETFKFILKDVPTFEEILAHIKAEEGFRVAGALEGVDDDGDAYSEIEAQYNAKELTLTVSYANGQINYTYYYDVFEIADEDIRYLAVENIKCPAKGTPSVERFYQEPFTNIADAIKSLEAMELHQEASPFGSEKVLLIMDINKLKENAWYQRNMDVINLLKEHPELDKPENFRTFAEEHTQTLEESLQQLAE